MLVLVSTVLRAVTIVDALVLCQYSNTDLWRMVWEIDLAACSVGIASRVATAGVTVVWASTRTLILIGIRLSVAVAITVALVITTRVISVIPIRHVECEADVLAQYWVVWEVEVG